jgi:carbonic anhydrase
MKRNLVFCALLVCAAPNALASGGAHWGYAGEAGPEHWGALDSAFTLCATGRQQSPIDISAAIPSDQPPLGIDYRGTASDMLNNGHTVQVNFPAGSTLNLAGQVFVLKQVHFHTPSETHLRGREFPFEAHFVHADAQGALAVIAVLFEDGAENAALAQLWTEMPVAVGELHALRAAFSPADLLPGDRDDYRFIGSLTTPPCSEGVRWQVLKQPLTLSRAQIQRFAALVHGRNDRPIQPLHARQVLD